MVKLSSIIVLCLTAVALLIIITYFCHKENDVKVQFEGKSIIKKSGFFLNLKFNIDKSKKEKDK